MKELLTKICKWFSTPIYVAPMEDEVQFEIDLLCALRKKDDWVVNERVYGNNKGQIVHKSGAVVNFTNYHVCISGVDIYFKNKNREYEAEHCIEEVLRKDFMSRIAKEREQKFISNQHMRQQIKEKLYETN